MKKKRKRKKEKINKKITRTTIPLGISRLEKKKNRKKKNKDSFVF